MYCDAAYQAYDTTVSSRGTGCASLGTCVMYVAKSCLLKVK